MNRRPDESPDGLYRAHAPALFRFLVRFTGDPELAADVLHDTFRTLLERPPARRDSLRGWLYRVAVNRTRDVQRKRGRRARLTTESTARRTLSDPPPPPDRAIHALEARSLAHDVLAALTPRDRTLLLMREEGFTHREMAQAVGTTTGSVGTLLARALDRVSRALERAQTTEEAPCP
ncbi:MAG: sigma-70 family RNA polymerase sigma factor [Gemmatimonadota bacterium]